MNTIRDISKPWAIFKGTTPLGHTELRILQARGKRWYIAIASEAKQNIWNYEHMNKHDIITLQGLTLVYASPQ